MAVSEFLREAARIIGFLKVGDRRSADTHIERAEAALGQNDKADPRYEDCLILNTMIRDYWDGIPTMDIETLEEQYHVAIGNPENKSSGETPEQSAEL